MKPKILITVRGGLIQGIEANSDVEISVADFDNIENDLEGDVWQWLKESAPIITDEKFEERIAEINTEVEEKKHDPKDSYLTIKNP